MVDETAEGNLFAALRTREADLEKHLASGQGAESEGRRAREGARGSAQEGSRKRPRSRRSGRKPLPEFGSDKDFQLAQALNRLKGKPVLVSKTVVERKAEDDATN